MAYIGRTVTAGNHEHYDEQYDKSERDETAGTVTDRLLVLLVGYLTGREPHQHVQGCSHTTCIVILPEAGYHLILDDTLGDGIGYHSLQTVTDSNIHLTGRRGCLRLHQHHDSVVELFRTDTPPLSYLIGKHRRVHPAEVIDRHHYYAVGSAVRERHQHPVHILRIGNGENTGEVIDSPGYGRLLRNLCRRRDHNDCKSRTQYRQVSNYRSDCPHKISRQEVHSHRLSDKGRTP